MNWDELYGGMKRIAKSTAKKLNETADMAALQVKLNAAQNKLEEAYTLLGRTSYLHFTGDEDLSKKVSLAIDCVEKARTEVRDIKLQIALAKQKAEEERAEREAMDRDTDPSADDGETNQSEA